jgi:hypothetical protein
MLNLFSAFGLIAIGAGSDKSLPATIAISTVGSAVAVFIVWGSANSFGVLLAFAILFGSLAPSLSGAWPSMVGKMQTDPSQVRPSMNPQTALLSGADTLLLRSDLTAL